MSAAGRWGSPGRVTSSSLTAISTIAWVCPSYCRTGRVMAAERREWVVRRRSRRASMSGSRKPPELEGSEYHYELLALAAGDRVSVGAGLEVEPFTTPHVVPSLGYHLIRRRRRLAPRFRDLPGPELAALRARGVELKSARRRTGFPTPGIRQPRFSISSRASTSPGSWSSSAPSSPRSTASGRRDTATSTSTIWPRAATDSRTRIWCSAT